MVQNRLIADVSFGHRSTEAVPMKRSLNSLFSLMFPLYNESVYGMGFTFVTLVLLGCLIQDSGKCWFY